MFCVTDLLPHLAEEQMKRLAAQIVKGRGSEHPDWFPRFQDDEGSELVKLNIMNILHEKYGIVEKDFFSAELEAVPPSRRGHGFDRIDRRVRP